MEILGYILIGAYSLALGYITVYCLLQLNLLYYYKKYHRSPQPLAEWEALDNIPFVTVQLPIYNEMYVVPRLIDCIVELEYPREKLEIQILDDSTDETVNIAKEKVEEYIAKGFDIVHVHRKDRQGYKAGALKEATVKAKGEFIAIFDADFLPRKNFLMRTIPQFKNNKVGVVQTRWEHINEDYSVLTKLQALQLNVHFRIEQIGRKGANCMLQFNGTAGVWRKRTILDAGGWEADTLTEDLDLSYRAQLKGWEIIYLEDLSSPAELPAEMNGLKSQQYRWMKGGAETARKMLPTVWNSNLSLFQKIHATGHLLSSGVFVFIFMAGVFSVPLVFLINMYGMEYGYMGYFLIGLVSVVAVYFVANVESEHKYPSPSNNETYFRRFVKFIILFPIFLSLSMGLSLHNTVAVIQGYIGKQSPFVRTPKFNIRSIKDSFKNQKYFDGKLSWTTIFEGLMAIYFLGGLLMGIYLETTLFIVFHGMLMVGFGTIFYFSLRHIR
ncbi:MAG: glycosyltransferase family 2 protein [Bacteroidia bacterium]|nr:glycosyltransferase family 2 protein [Bacteroidia bacterium]